MSPPPDGVNAQNRWPRRTACRAYSLYGIVLEAVANDKDLGVIVSDELTPGAHISHITKKCKQRKGLIKCCFTHPSADKVKILYLSLVKLVLKYGLPVSNPWYKKIYNCIRVSRGKMSKAMLRPYFSSQADHPQTGAGYVWSISIYAWPI